MQGSGTNEKCPIRIGRYMYTLRDETFQMIFEVELFFE